MIASPHTSNWDIYYARLAFYLMDIPVRFTIKQEWMRPPFGALLRRFGAIGIDRSPRKPGEERPSATEAMARLFETHEELAMMVTPEGTRKLRTEWKSGFYYVAKMAGVPIGLGYLDYANKVAGVGGMVWPSDDQDADFRKIMAFYAPIVGKHPEQFSIDLRYRPEGPSTD
jgi:1-acyl-sn-glycerol-3-phosphate acyltransferase